MKVIEIVQSSVSLSVVNEPVSLDLVKGTKITRYTLDSGNIVEITKESINYD